MTATTEIDLRTVLVATPLSSKAEDEQAWHEDRGEGVSASNARRACSRAAWEGLLDEMLNGSTFRGTAATADGHRYEPFILADLAQQRGTTIVENHRVWAQRAERRFMATPDGIEIDGETRRGVEVKTHQHGWLVPPGVIPVDHYDQMQWGMLVLELDEWVYGWTVLDADGEIPLEACPFRVVDRDEERIAELVAGVTAFLDWIDAGAPVDHLSETLAPLRDALVAAKANEEAAVAVAKAARERFEQALRDERPSAFVAGWSHAGDDGLTVTVARPARRVVLDEAAWAAAEPEKHAEWKAQRDAVAETETAARELYPSVKHAAAALRITKPKTTKAKATA